MKKIFQTIGDFFVFCSGANMKILNLPECEGERTKFVGIGSAVFFTSLFAFLSSSFAIFSTLKASGFSIIGGLIWALFIFSLDRYIVSTLKKEISLQNRRFIVGSREKITELYKATPRILISILIALSITKPIELKIFEREVSSEIRIMQEEKKIEQQEIIRKKYKYLDDDIEKREAEIRKLSEKIAEFQKRFDEFTKEAIEEADGSGGSKSSGIKQIYQVKKNRADKAREDLQSVIDTNQPIITKLQESIDKDKKSIQDDLKNVESNVGYDGLAAQIEALSRLGDKNEQIEYTNIVIVLLFLLIELAPLIFKLISDPTTYDYKLRAFEEYVRTKDESLLGEIIIQYESKQVLIQEGAKKFLEQKLLQIEEDPNEYIKLLDEPIFKEKVEGPKLKMSSTRTQKSISKDKENKPIELKPIQSPKKYNHRRKSHSISNGNYQPIQVDIRLQNDEKCYYTRYCDLFEAAPNKKKNPVKNNANKKSNTNLNADNLETIEFDGNKWVFIDNAILYITDKRVIFDTSKSNRYANLTTILKIIKFNEGIRIDRTSGKSLFLHGVVA